MSWPHPVWWTAGMKDVSQNSSLKIHVLMYSCFFMFIKLTWGTTFPFLVSYLRVDTNSVNCLMIHWLTWELGFSPTSPLSAVSQSENAKVLWEGIHMVLTCQENEYSWSSIEKLFTHCEAQCSSLIRYATLKTHKRVNKQTKNTTVFFIIYKSLFEPTFYLSIQFAICNITELTVLWTLILHAWYKQGIKYSSGQKWLPSSLHCSDGYCVKVLWRPLLSTPASME